MITPYKAIKEIRSLLWVNELKSLVSNVYIGKISLQEYDKAFNAKEKFIVINPLTLDLDQFQEGVVSVNIYTPDKAGVTDFETLDSIHEVVKYLLEDAFSGVISTSLGSIRDYREDDKKYSFYNQRVTVYADNVNQNQNIK